jgi:hypothetical protein
MMTIGRSAMLMAGAGGIVALNGRLSGHHA